MDWNYHGGLLTVSPDGPFDPAKTLLCGQCFRWQAEPDGSFSGIVRNRKVRIRTLQGGVQLWGFPEEEAPFYLHYFALDEDYCAIQKRLRRSRRLAAAIDRAPGIRVLHQDFFEVLESFIISQNNNIPRIRGIIERLCTGLGKPLEEGGYTFPTPEALAPLQKEDLAFLRAGWRADYLLDAARRVAGGHLDPCLLSGMPTDEARTALMETRGVGPKVADCVLLYGMGRSEVCPMDVWMKRAMARLFPRGMPRCAEKHAGIAQQYLFYAERGEGRF